MRRALCDADDGAARHSRAALLWHVGALPLIAVSALLLQCSGLVEKARKKKQQQGGPASIMAQDEVHRTSEEDAYLLRIKAMAENRYLTENESWGGGSF